MIKAFLTCKSLVKVLLITLVLSNFSAFAQKTTIFIVRHAEKDLTNPADKDPKLSAEGEQRASDLAVRLSNEHFTAIYTTPYKRTTLTATLVADANKLQPLPYKPSNRFEAVARLVLEQYKGKEVLIVGHSNTVVPLVNAFGAKSPVSALSDEDYDMLFKIVVEADGKAEVSVTRYGKAHHTTELP